MSRPQQRIAVPISRIILDVRADGMSMGYVLRMFQARENGNCFGSMTLLETTLSVYWVQPSPSKTNAFRWNLVGTVNCANVVSGPPSFSR